MKTKTKKILTRTGLAAVMALTASQASAYFLYNDTPPIDTQFEDNDIERLVNCDPVDAGCDSTAGDTKLDKGDSLRGVLTIDGLFTTFGSQPAQTLKGGSTDAGEEITGIFELEVLDKIDNMDGSWDFIFGPSASFEATYGTDAVLALFNEASGDLVTTADPTACYQTSVAECEARATDSDSGTWEMVFGFNDLDAQWEAVDVGTDDLSIVAAGGANVEFGDYNFALGLIDNNTGYNILDQTMACSPAGFFTCAGDDLIELIGSGTINGGLGLTGFDARSDFQFGIIAQVPAPTTVALLGLGLVGLGAMRRRKKA